MTVVRVQGEVDAATAPRMGETVNRLLARRQRVVLDLRHVDFMDLHGLGGDDPRHSPRPRDGGSFAIARPAPCVQRLVALVHAENELRILPTAATPAPRHSGANFSVCAR